MESRMREIRTSGLMRGSNGRGIACNSRPLLSTLPYSAVVFLCGTLSLSAPLRSSPAAIAPPAFSKGGKKPNVVIVITDDQGYGDLAFTGNPAIKTPTIDTLRTPSTLLNNFHVDPACAPTRSALMTGRYSDRVGVWHTVQGRSMLRRRETTMPDIFGANGYATGIFGKWHLGDCYPYRPEDRGFQHCVYHQAGGIGQAPDYWGNDYFDDTYVVNGKLQRFEGFCTDVWFDEGMKFIRENVKKGKPFLTYIAPNAPHKPLYCPEKYTRPYEGNPLVSTPEFYGMVTNIDDNMAKLMKVLEDEGVADNTILVFMTDNGTSGGLEGDRGYDGGMRGKKNPEYDGGHRVPFMIRWPVEADKGINDGTYGKAFNYNQARMKIANIDETKAIPAGAKEVTFKVSLKKGITQLAPTFIGPELTATPYYAYVAHKPKAGWQTPQGMGVPVYDPSYGRVPPQLNKKKTKYIE